MRTVLLLAASVLALSACGLRGELVRPVPMWGDPPNEGPNDPRTLKAEEDRKAADRAARDAQQRADDAANRKALEQQVQPPAATPPVPTTSPHR
jgi:hypothetical protein